MNLTIQQNITSLLLCQGPGRSFQKMTYRVHESYMQNCCFFCLLLSSAPCLQFLYLQLITREPHQYEEEIGNWTQLKVVGREEYLSLEMYQKNSSVDGIFKNVICELVLQNIQRFVFNLCKQLSKGSFKE